MFGNRYVLILTLEIMLEVNSNDTLFLEGRESVHGMEEFSGIESSDMLSVLRYLGSI